MKTKSLPITRAPAALVVIATSQAPAQLLHPGIFPPASSPYGTGSVHKKAKKRNEIMKQGLAALIGIMSFCLLGRADEVEANALKTLKNGRNIFRFDTFGDQAFWGGTLKLHQAIEAQNLNA